MTRDELRSRLSSSLLSYPDVLEIASEREAILPLTIEAFRRPANREMHENASWVLSNLGHIAVPFVIEMLESEEWQPSVCALLGKIGDPSAIPHLISALKSPDKWTRYEAANALSEMPSPISFGALVERLNDRTGFVRESVVEALVQIGDRRAIEPLNKLLDKKSVKGLERDLVKRAISALEGSPDPN